MNNNRLLDYLDHIQQAAIDAQQFIEGLRKTDFLKTNVFNKLLS
jgi:hypothetical protein